MHDWLISVFNKLALSAGSAILAFIAGRFWKGFVQPWVSDLWYSGPHLAKCYKGHFVLNGIPRNDLIELKQKASKVWGTMVYPDGGHGRYKFTGTISGNVLRGTFDGVREGPASLGVFLLIVDPRSNNLEGWFTEPYQGAVISLEYKWEPTRS